MPRDREYITDILDAIQLILDYTTGMQKEKFEKDNQCQDAVIRRIEIMGEAAKRISGFTQQRFRDVPWKDMAGMRDRVIHGYDTVDLDIVWDTINALPALAQQLRGILATGLPDDGRDSD